MKDFPILNRKIGDKRLVYLDNAATSQKPQSVIDALVDYYSNHNANVHRGLHTLSEEATEMYENARKKVAEFIGATVFEEVIFTKGTTEGINFVTTSYAPTILKEGDVVLTALSEHHSNLVPWQQLCEKMKVELKFIPLNEDLTFNLSALRELLSKKVKIVAISHASNVLGTIFPIKEISKLAKEVGAIVVVDGAQAVPHLKVNMQSLDVDFYAFSGHKMLGPTGIGVLWIKRELLNVVRPYQFGGGMIDTVEKEKSTWAKAPEKFEAGTPNIAGAVGLSAAVAYLQKIGMDNIRAHEIELTKYAIERLSQVPDMQILGTKDAVKRTGLIAFIIKGIHAHDLASILNTEGVAVRSGHHCTMPLMNCYWDLIIKAGFRI